MREKLVLQNVFEFFFFTPTSNWLSRIGVYCCFSCTLYPKKNRQNNLNLRIQTCQGQLHWNTVSLNVNKSQTYIVASAPAA